MSDKLSNHINIGKVLEERLVQVGIDSFEKLVEVGTENAFLRLQTVDPGACLTELCSLQGAIDGVKWNKLSPAKKEELKAFHKMVKK